MSIRARLNITGILGQQKVAYNDMHVLSDLLKKVTVPDEVRENIMRELGNGQAILDPQAMKEIPDVELELEKAEIRKLKQVLKDWNQYGPADLDWVEPIMKQLDEVPATVTQ